MEKKFIAKKVNGIIMLEGINIKQHSTDDDGDDDE
jgi:hypothetical protein